MSGQPEHDEAYERSTFAAFDRLRAAVKQLWQDIKQALHIDGSGAE